METKTIRKNLISFTIYLSICTWWLSPLLPSHWFISVYLSVCRSLLVCLSFDCLTVCLAVCLSVCLSVFGFSISRLFFSLQKIPPAFGLSVCLSVCLSICLSVCLSFCLSVFFPSVYILDCYSLRNCVGYLVRGHISLLQGCLQHENFGLKTFRSRAYD